MIMLVNAKMIEAREAVLCTALNSYSNRQWDDGAIPKAVSPARLRTHWLYK
jgi:hypothetical protein